MIKYDNMEPYEIIAETRKDCPVKPFPYLLNHPNSIESLRDYYGQSNDGARCWYLIDLIDNLLLSKLHVGLFVAAKDGKPLNRPLSFNSKQPGVETGADFEYRKAQQHVIFKGWEVRSFTGTYAQIHNASTGIFIEFHVARVCRIWRNKTALTKSIEIIEIKTIADLADVTTENPLKLK